MTDTSPEIAGAAGQVPAAPAWIVLAEPSGQGPAARPMSLRRVLFPVALAALVVAVIVAVAVLFNNLRPTIRYPRRWR